MSAPANVSVNANEPLVIWQVRAGSVSPYVLLLASAVIVTARLPISNPAGTTDEEVNNYLKTEVSPVYHYPHVGEWWTRYPRYNQLVVFES